MLKTVSSIANAIGALNYKGTWDASANTPTLTSGSGTKGDYYVVSVAGSTALDGVSNWGVGDWVAFNGTAWQRVEGGADLNGVNLSVTGVATFADGSVSAPSITNDGDTNTGIYFPAPDTIAFTEGGVESYRLHPSGGISIGNTTDPGATNLSVTGTGKFGTTVGVGAATPAASGAGITFPATQSASTDVNTLDDYEEGTYVPTVTCSTSGTITLNSSFNTLNYTKIGRLVSVTGFLYVSSVSSPVGYINITTPFTTGGTNKYSELSILISGSTTNCNNFVARQDSGGHINVFRGDSTSFALTSADTIQANTEFYISLTYQST